MSSSKLFAFNVSKQPEKPEKKPGDQWIGDNIVRANEDDARCTDQDYGLAVCWTNGSWCYTLDGSGYYICDSYF